MIEVTTINSVGIANPNIHIVDMYDIFISEVCQSGVQLLSISNQYLNYLLYEFGAYYESLIDFGLVFIANLPQTWYFRMVRSPAKYWRQRKDHRVHPNCKNDFGSRIKWCHVSVYKSNGIDAAHSNKGQCAESCHRNKSYALEKII